MDYSRDYLGKVIDNEDTTFSGRCRIRVFGVFDDMPEESIPWFYPINSNIFSSKNGAGSLSVPKLGTIVRVRFSNDNPYSGEFSAIQNIDPALIEEISSDYQNTHVLLYDSDKDLIITYQPMDGYKMWLAGSMIKIDADGTIMLKHKNNSNVVEITNQAINLATVTTDGTNTLGEINITSGATVNLISPTVNISSPNITIGNEAKYKAVRGEQLIKVLQDIIVELNNKRPESISPLSGKDFNEILSETITIS